MLKQNDVFYILDELDKLFPDASCELIYHNLYELIIAVVLSAQTTDKRVNMVTPVLFSKYPTKEDLANADINDVINIISSLGLAKNKANNIVSLSKALLDKEIPNNLDDLMALPGVGRKTANVVLSEGFKINRIAVDTHVARVSKRLGFADYNDDVLTIENKLMALIPNEAWSHAHHLFIHFGRYLCKAQNPDCINCPLKEYCIKK